MNASTQRSRQPRIAIVGAGPGGLCMAIQLKRAGFSDFVLLEKGDGVGGTWAHNRYPGCACDLPSFLYSFSFEVKSDWSRPYAPQPETLAYMQEIAEKYELLLCDAGSSDGEVLGVTDQDSVPVGDMAVVVGIVWRVQSPV